MTNLLLCKDCGSQQNSLVDGRCPDCLKKYEERGWFKTSKPLPDGDYGWRLKKGDKPLIYSVVNGNAYFKREIVPKTRYEKLLQEGEWCRIVWPD